MADSILVEQRAGWRKVTLNRPEKLNALDRTTLHALIATLAEAEADETCRALLLTGTGRGFCAGAELGAAGVPTDGPRDLGASIEQGWNPLARKLHTLRMPTVCAVNGIAAGAGASLALGCDIVVAARSARFLQAFARIGLVPDCGGTWLLPNLAGQARARGMAMLAEPIPADTALAWGMIWSVAEDDVLLAEAEALAARLAAMPTQALLLTRAALSAAAHTSFDAQLDIERDSQRAAGNTPDHVEGVRAFLEKRPAVFTGKAG
jgi:2-(1,2-epoxy-1,2-dihydrophenyl)acetyl-CoA isomerase